MALFLGTHWGQYRQHNAGLRTNALVALEASAFVDLSMRMNGNAGASGAVVIITEGMNIRGLNTAATIWCSAVAEAYAGADREAEASLLAFFILAGNTFLRPPGRLH